VQVTIRDAGDLKRLNKQLRQVADGKALRKELTGGLREVLRPLVPTVRSAYLAQPGHKGRYSRSRRTRPPLRSLLASSVRIEVRTTGKLAGARIRVDGRRMPSGSRSLPGYWEATKRRGWRHPLFGDRGRWYGQPARPIFHRTVEPHEAEAGRAVDEVMERTRRKLEGR
jgi:hypothetical protein